MELNKQVVSLELAKRLKELDVKQESYFGWKEGEGEQELVTWREFGSIEHTYYAAFTVAELAGLLQTVAERDIIIALTDNHLAETLGEDLCTRLQSSKGSAGSGPTQ